MGVNSFTIHTIKLPERLLGLNNHEYVNLSPPHAPKLLSHRKQQHWGVRFSVKVCLFDTVYVKRHVDVSFSS